MNEVEYRPRNQERDPNYNREPGIAIIPGSNYAKEMAKFEQFDSKFTAGSRPGNPYVYRPFPKMLYRAQHHNGVAICMGAPPRPDDFANPNEYERACRQAEQVTRDCQKIVNNELEMSRAMEDGWREDPAKAVEYLRNRDKERSTVTAHRNYEDRNMSEPAKREIAAAIEAVGGDHIPEIPEQPKKRRGRPPKNAAPAV